MVNRVIYNIITITALLITAQGVFAATFTASTITVSPQNPQAGNTIEAKIHNYSTDIQTQNIQWLLNGRVIKSGVGLSHISLTLPKKGQQAVITAKITTKTKPIITRKTIPLAAIDLLWEAKTYTPPFYLGRSLPTDGSEITLFAISRTGNSHNLIYNWYSGTTHLRNFSGKGKNTITIHAPSMFNSKNITVRVSRNNGGLLGSRSVYINSVKPKLLLYPSSPLLGIHFPNQLSDGAMYTQSSQNPLITAVPFYFSISNPSELVYTWSATHSKSIMSTNKNSITFSTVGDGDVISVSANKKSSLAQYADVNYIVKQTLEDRSSTTVRPKLRDYKSVFGNSNE